METQQTSVERLSSGVVKLFWIWHGKIIQVEMFIFPHQSGVLFFFLKDEGIAGSGSVD